MQTWLYVLDLFAVRGNSHALQPVDREVRGYMNRETRRENQCDRKVTVWLTGEAGNLL